MLFFFYKNKTVFIHLCICVCMCVSGEGGYSGVGQYWVVGAQGYVGMFPPLRNKFSFLVA